MSREEEAAALLDEAEAETPEDWIVPEDRAREIAEGSAFLVTCAQNNTLPHSAWQQTFHTIAEHYGARPWVIPMRYKNPTSRRDPQEFQGEDADYWWHPSLRPYMLENDVSIHRKLRIMGRMRIQATAVHPLSGLEGMTADASGIYGHPQVSMRVIPTARDYPKVLITTGSITKRNYSTTKAGQKGEFHHTLGAVLVQKWRDMFFLRPINFDESTGTACDLNLMFGPGTVQEMDHVPALVTGDEHAVWIHPGVKEATYLASDSMVNVLRPKVLVRHDVLDSYTVSHWHRYDGIRQAVKRAYGYDDIQAELELTRDHIDETTPEWSRNVIVASNHHEHLLRWLNEGNKNPTNEVLYHRLKAEVLEEAIRRGPGAPDVDAFVVWSKHWGNFQTPTRFLARNESFRIFNVELGYHGDKGPNGARGTPTSFSKIGTKVVCGHTHTPAIEKGATFVGCSVRPLEYLQGPSSWLHCHCIVHPNGKRQLVTIVDRYWRPGV